jgi:hypothetical protein
VIPHGIGEQPVELRILDAAGRPVKHLVRALQPAGCYQVCWRATDRGGRPLQDGVYFCQLRVGGQTRTRKVVAVRQHTR